MQRVRKSLKAMEMFGNKSKRNSSKISDNMLFGVDESLKFAACYAMLCEHL